MMLRNPRGWWWCVCRWHHLDHSWRRNSSRRVAAAHSIEEARTVSARSPVEWKGICRYAIRGYRAPVLWWCRRTEHGKVEKIHCCAAVWGKFWCL